MWLRINGRVYLDICQFSSYEISVGLYTVIVSCELMEWEILIKFADTLKSAD